MYDHDTMIVKLDKLYWRVHGKPGARKIEYSIPGRSSKGDDLTWCRKILADAKDGLVPTEKKLRQSNELWKKYKY